MTSFGNAASSHSGLIPLKTAFQKGGDLLWAITRKKNFINPHSAAFVRDVYVIWSIPTNFALFQKLLDTTFYKLDNLEIICQ